MAGIEKISEVSSISHGWRMYGYKRNHIQITPQERKLFRNKKAVLFIFKPAELRHIGKHYTSSVTSDFTKYNGRWHMWTTTPSNPWTETLCPVRVLFEYAYCLYVPDIQGTVEGCFWNWTYEMNSVKRRISRMMRYKVPVIKLDITYTDFCKENNDIVVFNEYFAKVHDKLLTSSAA